MLAWLVNGNAIHCSQLGDPPLLQFVGTISGPWEKSADAVGEMGPGEMLARTGNVTVHVWMGVHVHAL